MYENDHLALFETKFHKEIAHDKRASASSSKNIWYNGNLETRKICEAAVAVTERWIKNLKRQLLPFRISMEFKFIPGSVNHSSVNKDTNINLKEARHNIQEIRKEMLIEFERAWNEAPVREYHGDLVKSCDFEVGFSSSDLTEKSLTGPLFIIEKQDDGGFTNRTRLNNSDIERKFEIFSKQITASNFENFQNLHLKVDRYEWIDRT
jgi:hypothetical protein